MTEIIIKLVSSLINKGIEFEYNVNIEKDTQTIELKEIDTYNIKINDNIIIDNFNKIEFESDYIIINYDIKIKDVERVEVYWCRKENNSRTTKGRQ